MTTTGSDATVNLTGTLNINGSNVLTQASDDATALAIALG